MKGEIPNIEKEVSMCLLSQGQWHLDSLFFTNVLVFQFHDDHVLYKIGAVGREGLKVALALCI